MVKKKSMNVVIPSVSANGVLGPHIATGTPLHNPTHSLKEDKVVQAMTFANTPLLSPGSAAMDFTEWARQIHMLASEETREVDVQTVKGLLDAMKSTVGALGGTFDALGDQTAKLAQLGPAMDVAHRVRILFPFCIILIYSELVCLRMIVVLFCFLL